MNAETDTKVVEDFASISVDLPLAKEDVYSFIRGIERLYRINPHLEIKSWQEDKKGEVYSGKKIRVDSLNEMNGMQQNITLSLGDLQQEASFSLSYDSGLKQATIFTVEGTTQTSSKLIVKELYPADLSVAEREARLNEVDKSLVPWGEAIHSYFKRRARWGWLPLYSWFQDTFWLGMSPRHRRVARLIILTTVLEFVVFMFVFVIYWLELGRGKF